MLQHLSILKPVDLHTRNLEMNSQRGRSICSSKRLLYDLRKVQCFYLVVLCWVNTFGSPKENWLVCYLSRALHTDWSYFWLYLFLFRWPLPSLLSPIPHHLSVLAHPFFYLPFIPLTGIVWSAFFSSSQLVLSLHFILRNMGMVITLRSYCGLIQFFCD